MGLTILPLEVANQSSPQQTETVEFLIDPGALYSVVPRPVLERLGIAPVGEQKFRLASEQTIQRQTGGALFKYGDRLGVAAVIFGEPSDSTLLGAHTLESLGLALDPIRRELMPLPMMLASVPATDEPL
jgi:predicted aspartyl protease